MNKFFPAILFAIASLCCFSQSSNCTTATNLSLSNGSACVNGTSAGAITDNILYGNCNSAPVNMVWYTYVTNGSNNSFTITPGTLTNAEIVIYQGGCPNTGTLQNCVTANGSNALVTTWGMTAGVQVWIGIASNGGVSGSFQFCVNSTPPSPGPGNTCSQAKPICTAPFVQSTIPNNSSGQKPACFASAPQQDIWIKFTITQAGLLAWTATGNNATTEFDWALWDISNGCPGTVVCCNYNYAAGSGSGFGMQASAGNAACGTSGANGDPAEFCAPVSVTCGKTYAIQISNYSNNNVGFSLSFTNSTALINSTSLFSVNAPTVVCGSSLNAVINNASTGACAQVWNFGDGTPTYTGSAPPNHTYSTPGTYAITANIPGACPSNATQYVQLLAPLAATLQSLPVNCFGDCNGSASLAAVSGGDGMYSYSWNTGSTATSISPVCAGIYTLTVSNAKCASSISQTVMVNAPTQLSITANSFNPGCAGNNGSVTANGAGGTAPYTYALNAGVYISSGTFTGLSAGTYSVFVKDSKNCIQFTTFTLSAAVGPTITVNSMTTCAGVPVTLSVSGANSYTWSPATGLNSTSGSSVSAILNATQTYTVLGSISSCTALTTLTVTVNPLPLPSAFNGGPYCSGQTAQLNVNPFVQYTWSGPQGYSSQQQSPPVLNTSTLNAGIYTVSVTDINGCVNTSTTSLVINPSPSPQITSNSPVCENAAISLSVNGSGTFQWNGPNNFNSAVQNPVIPNASTLQAGVYSVTVSALGCMGTSTTSVTIITPVANASNGGPYCSGNSIQLNTPSAASYQWSGPNGFSSALQNPSIINSSVAMAGVYSVIVTAGSCTAAATTTVVVNALPVISATGNGPLCAGQSAIFNGAGGGQYSWTGPAAFTSSAQSPSVAAVTSAQAGNYTLTVTDANNCSSTAVYSLAVNNLPVVSASGATVCQNSNAQLSANGGSSYSWTGPGGFTSNQQNPVISNTTPNGSGVYTVLITDVNTCTNTATAILLVNAAPVATVGSNGPVCLNSPVSLSASGGVSYLWAGPNNFSSSIQNPSIASASQSVAGVYTVTATAQSGCTGTQTINLVVNNLPVPVITGTNLKGCVPLCAAFTVSSAPSASFVTWNFGNGLNGSGTSQNACYTSSGNFIVTANITDVNGCMASATTSIEVYPKPTADFVFSPVKPIENNDPVQFTDLSHGTPIAGWSWYFSQGLTVTSSEQNPELIYKEAGEYAIALVVSSDKGCLDTVLKVIHVGEDFGIWVPNAFTPNGDGVNDFFSPKGFGVIKYQMQIFDRWGESVFFSDNFATPWYGNFQGRSDEICKEDVYVWKIRVSGPNGKVKEMTGHVSLLK